jgi:hypothetical protein
VYRELDGKECGIISIYLENYINVSLNFYIFSYKNCKILEPGESISNAFSLFRRYSNLIPDFSSGIFVSDSTTQVLTYFIYFESKWKEAYAIIMLSVCLRFSVVNLWKPESVFMKLDIYFLGTWAHPNGLLHKSRPCVCVYVNIAAQSYSGNEYIHSRIVGTASVV